MNREERLRGALEEMVYQFGYWSEGAGGIGTGGLSALEYAFEVLRWEDPRPVPEMRCDEPGCMRQISNGWPSPTGYRQTCHEHWDTAHPGECRSHPLIATVGA